MREEIHRLATATAFRLKPEATLTLKGLKPEAARPNREPPTGEPATH
jgi:hypothetical protein